MPSARFERRCGGRRNVSPVGGVSRAGRELFRGAELRKLATGAPITAKGALEAIMFGQRDDARVREMGSACRSVLDEAVSVGARRQSTAS